MINQDQHPIEWSRLMYDLEDAKEHLTTLIDTLDEGCTEEEFKVWIEHIYAHLNRAWNNRDIQGDMTEQQWIASSDFPKDINPL